MKQKVKLKGHLKSYLQTNLILGILLALVNVGIYLIDMRAGMCISAFLVIYLIAMSALLYRNKPMIINEFIDFAARYGQVQKKLLTELELPHVLMDETGRIVWMNTAFEQIIHKDKNYKKSISTVFSSIVKDKLDFEKDTEIELAFEEHEYTFKMKRVSVKDVFDDSDLIESIEDADFLIAGYLFDETALKRALRENDEQSLAIGMIYIDNYDEALESVEDVRRSLLIALIDRKINKYILLLTELPKKLRKTSI